MAVINFARREIEVKIVYYGCAFSGKTTNVEILHRLMPPAQRGELHALRTEQDRTLFFDYFPVQLGEIAGFKARFKLFTVPGQVFYKQTRRVVLQGADAVVFVADSTPDRATANLDSLIDLEENLRTHGLDLASIPLVVQLNKRDAPGALPVEQMVADLNPFGVPAVEAIAAEGRGVLDTLRRVTEIAGQRIRENLSGQATAVQLDRVERAEAEDDHKVVREHIERIKAVRAKEEELVRGLQAEGKVQRVDLDSFLHEQAPTREDTDEALGDPDTTGDMPSDAPAPDEPSDEVGRTELEPDDESSELPADPPPSVTAEAPPVDAPVATAQPSYDPGPAIDAWIVAAPGTLREIRGASVAPDGRAVVDAVVESGGRARLHPIVLRPKPPETKPPTWATATTAAMFGGGAGFLVGLGVAWLAFSLRGG